jgi:hypothetical protein
MTVISAPDPELYSTMQTGDMSASELVSTCERLFGQDARHALINVLNIVEADADHLMAGTKMVPAPLAVALLRCGLGLPILRDVNRHFIKGRLAEMHKAKDRFVALLSAPSTFSDNEDHVNVFDRFAEQTANEMILRLYWQPDISQW